jgi:hypothetical protein
MGQFPRWRDLKHLSSATTIDYSDGQTFLDILKVFVSLQCFMMRRWRRPIQCALPCLVQILPPNSSLVRIVRNMQKLRIMLGLPVTTKSRLDHLRDLICKYERISAVGGQTIFVSLFCIFCRRLGENMTRTSIS